MRASWLALNLLHSTIRHLVLTTHNELLKSTFDWVQALRLTVGAERQHEWGIWVLRVFPTTWSQHRGYNFFTLQQRSLQQQFGHAEDGMEESTYFCYAEGVNADKLRLGSLAFDYANPRTRTPYIHKPSKSLLDDPPQAAGDQRPTCYMAFERGKSNNFGAGLKSLLEFDHSRAGSSYSLVVGKNGSKVELNRWVISTFTPRRNRLTEPSALKISFRQSS